MSTPSQLYAKFGLKATQSAAEPKSVDHCFLHDIIVNPVPYKGRDSLQRIRNNTNNTNNDDHYQYINPKTSFYLCKKYQPSIEFERLPRYLMKRLAYRKSNPVDRWGRVIYNDAETKNYDQVATEFHCLSLLKGSHRAIQLISVIHENTKSKEDKRFFYHNLRLPDRRSRQIKNICFILEEMAEGSLREQIDRVTLTKEPFKEEKIIQYACQFAQGLLELRSKGIIHRDLRPENVLVHNGQIKFADFDSAFIKGYSDYRNIKNGVDMKQTTPLEIMFLIAESQENLKKMSSEELFARQQKADIYFLGVNIYTMVFSQLFESFNGGKVLKNLINIKKRSGFCPKLLDLMARCLEKDPHVRIDMNEVVKILGQIEREMYFKSSTYKRIYLGPEPLNLYSFSSNQVQSSINSEAKATDVQYTNNREEMQKNIAAVIRESTLERYTSLYQNLFKRILEDWQGQQKWGNSEKNKVVNLNQQILLQRAENFLQRLQIKAYYYELAYRILCEVNLAYVKSPVHFQNIRSHLELFSSQLVVVLTFIYGTVTKLSFTSDPNYSEFNSSYEIRKVFENIKTLHSRWEFFSGRLQLQMKANSMKKQMKEQLNRLKQTSQHREFELVDENFSLTIEGIKIVESLLSMVEGLKRKAYENESQRFSFQSEQRSVMRCLEKMESIVKKEMIQTIISLILAYEKIKLEPWGHRSNLKNAIFMLMILQAQNTKIVEKNDLVIIKSQLTTMITMNLGWKSEELEAFFTNYTHSHTEQVIKGLCQLESQAIITTQQNAIQQPEDICIQINGLYGGVESAKAIDKKISQPQQRNTPKAPDQILEKPEPEPEIEHKNDTIQDVSDKAVEVSHEVNESRVRETFEYNIFQTDAKEAEKVQQKSNVPKPQLVLVEYYD